VQESVQDEASKNLQEIQENLNIFAKGLDLAIGAINAVIAGFTTQAIT
jgi:hypothetical protein